MWFFRSHGISDLTNQNTSWSQKYATKNLAFYITGFELVSEWNDTTQKIVQEKTAN